MLENNLEQIVVREQRLHISFPEISDYTFALYIKYKNKIEKQFYQNDNYFVSDLSLVPGVYTATFFYKNNIGEKSYRKRLFKISDKFEVFFIEQADLVEKENYKITYFNIGVDKTFIVFNGAGSTKQSEIFGLEYLLERGYNVVACLQDNDNNYQDLSFSTFQRILTPYIKEHEVYLYGSSLGGYCAFYYAGAVNGAVISAAPMNPVDPKIIKKFPNESEYKDDDFVISKIVEEGRFKHASMADNVRTKKKCYVFIDPLVDRDIYYLQEKIYPSYPQAVIIPIEFAGHTILYHLSKTGQLSNIIENIVNGENIDIDREIESEFTYYEKAKYYLSLSRKMANLCLDNEPVNPLIRKRVERLKDAFHL